LTAIAVRKAIAKDVWRGMDDFVSKPIDVQTLT
jgi:hypothetical protein